MLQENSTLDGVEFFIYNTYMTKDEKMAELKAYALALDSEIRTIYYARFNEWFINNRGGVPLGLEGFDLADIEAADIYAREPIP